MTDIVDRETAESEVERWAAAMRLDLERESDDAEVSSIRETSRLMMVKSIQGGQLIINDEGQAVFTTEDGDPFTFYRPRGDVLLSADKKKDGHDAAKSYAMMGVLTRKGAQNFTKMYESDKKTCQAIMSLFLI